MNTVYLAPIVGALIGYCTNWLAIKMVFRPHEEKRIFGIKVPFTPGLIAVERDRITDQIGYVITNHLLTDSDLKNKLLELDFDSYTKTILNSIETSIQNSDLTVDDVLRDFLKDDYDNKIKELNSFITEKYNQSFTKSRTPQELIILEQDIRMVAPEFLNIVKTIFEDDMYGVNELLISFFDNLIAELFSGLGALFGGFISSEKIYSLLKSKIVSSIEDNPSEIEDKIVNMILSGNGSDHESFKLDDTINVITKNMLSTKINSFAPAINVLQNEKFVSTISTVFKTFLSNEINDLLNKIDIKDLVVKKMNEMPLMEIETLILSIAKKEITAITNVGGVLGAIVGFISIIFY